LLERVASGNDRWSLSDPQFVTYSFDRHQAAGKIARQGQPAFLVNFLRQNGHSSPPSGLSLPPKPGKNEWERHRSVAANSGNGARRQGDRMLQLRGGKPVLGVRTLFAHQEGALVEGVQRALA
jgi:hypothetical protein